MGIDGIKRAIGNAVNNVKQAATDTVKSTAHELALSKRALELDTQLAGLKGWGPETAAKRKELTTEKTQVQAELTKIASARRERSLETIRNIR